MSNLPEPAPSLTEKLTVKKVLQAIGARVFVLSNIINYICIAVIFIYLGSTVSVLKSYADYVAVYILGARIVFLALGLSVGCYYWCCLRLVAPKQAGSSISEWVSKVQARCEAFSLDYGKGARIFIAIVATFNTFHGLNIIRRSWELPMFGVYQPVLGILCLMNCAQLFHMAWTWNFGRDNMSVGNDDDDEDDTNY